MNARKCLVEWAKSQASITITEGARMREKRIIEYMSENPNGNRCSRCGVSVKVARGTAACVCFRCTHLLAQLWAAGYWKKKAKPARLCPDCGSTLRKRRRYCDACTRRRTRKRDRAKKRQMRKQPVALSPS